MSQYLIIYYVRYNDEEHYMSKNIFWKNAGKA